jgi:hypothetical protein
MRRVLLWLSVALLVLLGAGLLWLHHASPSHRPTERYVITTDPVTGEWLSASTTSASEVGQQPAQVPTSAPAFPVASSDQDASVWDLCGIGRLPIPQALLALASGQWTELPKHLGESAQALGRERLLQALSQGDARARAAGLLLKRGFTQKAALDALPTRSPFDAPAAEAAHRRLEAPATQEELRALAYSSGDGTVAHWALVSCGSDHACRAKANALWRQVDPGNAAPWLIDLSLVADNRAPALAAIEQARRHNNYHGALASVALAAMPADIPSYVQRLLLMDVMSVQANQMMVEGYTDLVNSCKPPAAAGRLDKARCDVVARLLTERSDSLLSHMIGLSVGEWAGWPAAEVRQRKAEMRKLMEIQGEVWLPNSPYSCAAVEQSHAFVRDVAANGEVAALRALAANKASKATKPATPP